MSSLQKENKMGVMKMNRLLLTTSAPLMLSMLIQALYNIVDSVFVSWYGEANNLVVNNLNLPLNAVTLAFPAQNLMIAVGVGTGVGVNALLSRKLGEKDGKAVSKIASNAVFLGLCNYLLFLILGLTVVHPFFLLQTNNSAVIDLGWQYLTICMCASFAVFMQIIFERLMQSTGKTVCVMFSHGLGAFINIILDPIFIFVFDMGVVGAAIATVLGQFGGMLLSMVLHFRFNHEVKLEMKGFKPDKTTVGEIYKIALPSIVMQSIGSVMTFCMNKILYAFSEIAVNVFGIYFKIQSFIFMPIFGLNNGMVPIIGYNYGAKKRKRIEKVIKLAIIYAASIMAVGVLVFQLFPEAILWLFKANEESKQIGIPALRIISTHFIFAGVSIVLSSTFQAFGQAVKSMIVSLTRQLAVLIPCAWLLSFTGNVNLVWLSLPIAELVSVTLCVVMFIDLYKKTIKLV